MTSFDDAVSAVKHHSAAFQSVLRSWPAYLGDGDGNVIGSQVNYYHCRYPTPESPAIEVYANGCPPNDGLRVMVGTTADQPNLIQVVSWNDSSQDDVRNDHVKNHGDQHTYLGGDTVWVDWRQITTFRVQPYSGLTVYVEGGVLPRAGTDLQVIPQIVDLTSSVPGSAGQARYALLSIDTTGAIVVTDGTVVSPIMALDASDVPSTPAGNFRLAAVALQYGQVLITESLLQRDILDLRWPQESMAGSGVITPGMLQNADAQYRYLVSGSTPFAFALSSGFLNIASGKTLTVSNSITLTGTDGGTTSLAVTSGKTLTLTAADDYNLTIPKTGTAVTGTGTAGRISEWVTDANTLQASTLIKSGVGVLTISAANTVTATFPNTGNDTIAMLNVSNAFTQTNSIIYALTSASQLNGLTVQSENLGSGGAAGLSFQGRSWSGNAYGMVGFASLNSTASDISATNVFGGQFQIGFAVVSPRTATVTNASGLEVSRPFMGTGTHSMFAVRGVHIGDYGTPSGSGTWTITGNTIGLLLDNQTGAANRYGIYAGTAVSGSRLGHQLVIDGSTDVQQFKVTGYTTQAVATTVAQITRNDVAAGISAMLGLTALGSGADGDGGSVLMAGKSSTTAAQSMGLIEWYWPSTGGATHASRFSAVTLSAYSTTNKRTGVTVQADSVASVTTIGAAQAGAYATTAINLTLTTAHHWVKATAACTITLPTAVGISGREYSITATANSVIVDGNASETISGSLTVTLNSGDSLQIKSDGANWFII